MAETNKTTVKESATSGTEKTFTQKDIDNAVKNAVEMALKNFAAQQTSVQPTVIQVAKDEQVTVLFFGLIAQGTVVDLRGLGTITKDGTMLDIPKKVFMNKLGTPLIDELLRSKHLIVVNGLTDDERERFGLRYKEGELLTTNTFYRLLDYSDKEVCKIFNALCDEHKKLVAKMFYTAYFKETGADNRITPEKVKALNKLSKSVSKEGLFKLILEDMGRKFGEDA